MCVVSFSSALSCTSSGWMSARRSSRSWNRNAVASISVPRKYAPPVSGCDTNLRYLSAARIRCRELFGMSSLTAELVEREAGGGTADQGQDPEGAVHARHRRLGALLHLPSLSSAALGNRAAAALARFRHTES